MANLARNCGFCLALSGFTWFMLSKRCSTLHLISLAVVCKRTVFCIVCRKQPTSKMFQKVGVGQSSEKGAVSKQRDQSTGTARCEQLGGFG